MSFIIGFLASVLGFVMDLFFRGLTLIGYPRLWACIILYAAATRFLFLPQRIKNYKRKLLAPVINRDLITAAPEFFKKITDKETAVKRALLKKEVHKKYKVHGNSGCLSTIFQFPLLLALFYVVKNPQKFVPSLESLSDVSANVNSFLGVSLAKVPLDSIKAASGETLILCVPIIVMLFNIAKMFPSLKRAKTAIQKVKVYGLCAVFTLLLGWFSVKLPVAISLYWVANDITYLIFDFFIHRLVPKSEFISGVLKEYKENLSQSVPVSVKESENLPEDIDETSTGK